MKEEDAKTKWCPMSKLVIDSPGYASGNRFQDTTSFDEKCTCIGRDCMLWRSTNHLVPRTGNSENFGECGLKVHGYEDIK